jgi:glycosyltransferase involved in cell wall biosynthesis
VMLPNLVDERTFGDLVARRRKDRDELRRTLKLGPTKRVLLTLARLTEDKGLLEFINALIDLPEGVASRLTVMVGGEGPLRPELEALLSRQPELDVRLLGHVPESDVVALLAASDGFVLPSLSEPNPLSAIEALWAGLPLLLSDRVGNHPDILEPGENGWLFDPHNPHTIRAAVAEWVEVAEGELARRGNESHVLATKSFRTDMVIDTFLNTLLDVA